jgi:hypothetical protein
VTTTSQMYLLSMVLLKHVAQVLATQHSKAQSQD